jgi:hypothetical protein
MPYKLIRAPNLKTLEFNTDLACAEGWQPSGGPFANADQREWCQAVTRSTAPPEPEKLKLKEGKR